ncbi:IclR family transcriptional regulator [Acidovorax sp. MR-S7]|uniref:IclR family transcriptional regulator n=1 Tax=Acidovorax sp. MR-S7 TaxID=1268622 RepID=UPI00036274A2|nr:IclR family transcriptional regulator [Acidovorax sp. MR-S7]GAD24568.1 transcriptional regulator [Acidovorax sp. MR-S7]
MNNTLIKGLQLLELIVRSDRPRALSELAMSIGVGKSSVHRLLQGLVESGYLEKDVEKGSYRATLRIWELGQSMDAVTAIKAASADAMARLLGRTRETVHLSVLQGNEVVYLAKLDSPEPVRAYSEVGGRAPAHCVATGKALLAWLPKETLAPLSKRLKRHTPSTITEPAAFLQEMEHVRSSGFAVNHGEWRDAVWGVAAPIRRSDGVPLAAIGISGPASRIKAKPLREFADEVLSAARSISSRL